LLNSTPTGVAGAQHVRPAQPVQQRRHRQRGDRQHQAAPEALQDTEPGAAGLLDDAGHRSPLRRWLDADMSQAEQIVAGLGGKANIVEIEACITRLRTQLSDAALVDEGALRAAGVHGVMRAGTVVQVVVGPGADTLASDIEDLI
jgi:PTS system N-acetylglucosamine-specific IIB component